MTALSLSPAYNSYSSYTKCGEILKSPAMGKKQYALLCLQCHEICLHFKTFVVHLEQQHQHANYAAIEPKHEEEEQEQEMLQPSADSEALLMPGDSPRNLEDEDTKAYILDPLGEPEMLVKKPKHKAQAKCMANEVKRKSAPAKKLQATDPVDVLVDNIKIEQMPSNEIEFINPSVQSEEDEDFAQKSLQAVPLRLQTNCSTESHDESYTSTNYDLIDDDELEDDDMMHEDYYDDDYEEANDNEFMDSGRDDDNEDEDTDGAKPTPAKKSKVKLEAGLDIDEFMNNRVNVLLFIESYQKQDELWDATRPPKLVNRCRKKRDECLKQICQELKDMNVHMTIRDAEKCIKYMRVRYIRDVRIRLNYIKNKDRDYKPLWFHDHLEFLKPTLSFIQDLQEEQLLAKPKLQDTQIVRLIELYQQHSCLWNEQDIFYYSEQRRQAAMKTLCEDINSELDLNYSLHEVEDIIEFIHKLVKKEKANMIEAYANKPSKSYKSACKFAQHISYLLPHLGPFKCQYCPKVLMHIATFRIHTAKHDGSKPFKCSICMYEFTQKPGYVIHLRRHTQDFPFVCKYCGKGFPCKKELMLHFQNHPEYAKEFICDICGEGFTQQKLLNWHLKAHNNIRDAICNICGKGFTNSKLLFQHRTVHSQEKSVCKLCGKTYAHYRGLSRHMAKDHGTTVAAVAAVMGEKPKKRVLTINEIS